MKIWENLNSPVEWGLRGGTVCLVRMLKIDLLLTRMAKQDGKTGYGAYRGLGEDLHCKSGSTYMLGSQACTCGQGTPTPIPTLTHSFTLAHSFLVHRQWHESVTVLFADIVGFTPMSQ